MASAKTRLGDVVRFDLGDGLYAFGRVYPDKILIYRSSGEDIAPVATRDFVLAVSHRGRLEPELRGLSIVGRDPLSPDEDPSPPTWFLNESGKATLLVGACRPASSSERQRYQRLVGGTWNQIVAFIRQALGFAGIEIEEDDEPEVERAPIDALTMMDLPREPGEVTIEIRVPGEMPTKAMLKARDAIEAFFSSREGEEVDDVGAGGGVMIIHIVTDNLRRTAEEAFRLVNSHRLLQRTRIFAERSE
jgi:hypothetical protein